jgi:uncharacterized protein (DUF433 family)
LFAALAAEAAFRGHGVGVHHAAIISKARDVGDGIDAPQKIAHYRYMTNDVEGIDPSPFASIGSLRVAGPRTLEITWSSGSRAGVVETVDISSVLERFKIFTPLRDDPALFATARLIEDGDVIAWDGPDLELTAETIAAMTEADEFAKVFRESRATIDPDVTLGFEPNAETPGQEAKLDPEDAALFEMFEREGWSRERQNEHMAALIKAQIDAETSPDADYTPGPKTRAAMNEARRGGLKSFSSIDDLMTDLNDDSTGGDAYIEIVDGVQGGRPVIKGTRLTVSAIQGRLSSGDTIEILLEEYPDIPRRAFEAAARKERQP